MPKMKTHSGTKDRMKVTKNGKVLHGSAGGNHLLQKKSKARKRTYAVPTVMTGKSARNIKKKLGVQ
jgi:large subunit ribosomal protein L35